MSRPYRWTRERYYRAQHLRRAAVYLPGDMPRVCVMLYEALDRAETFASDPLLTPVRIRLRNRREPDDDIPF